MAEVRNKLPVDHGWAWVIVFGYFMSVMFMVGLAKSSGILLGEFIGHFNIPVALAAVVMGVVGGMYTISAPICVVAGTHYSQRVVVMIGGLIGGVGLSLSCLLFSIEWVIIIFGVLFGFGNACVFGNGLVLIGHYFDKKRGLAMGLGLSGASVGQLLFPPLLQFLLDTYALQGTLLIIGALYMNVMVCGALYRPPSAYSQTRKTRTKAEEQELLEVDRNVNCVEPDCRHKDGDDKKLLDIKTSGNGRLRMTNSGSVIFGSVDSLHTIVIEMETQSSPKSKMAAKNSDANSGCRGFLTLLIDLNVLKSYISVLFLMVSFFVFFGYFSFVLFLPRSAALKGITKYENALLISISGVCDLFGRLLIGFVGDLNYIARYKLYVITTLFAGFSIAGFAFANTYWWLAIQAGLYGFFGGAYVSINIPVLIDLVGLRLMGKLLGTVLFIQGLGAAIGQPSLGAVRDAMGSFDEVNYICSVSMVIGSLLLLLYPLARKLDAKSQLSTSAIENDDAI